MKCYLFILFIFPISFFSSAEDEDIKSVNVSLIPGIAVLDWYKRYAVAAYQKLGYKVTFKELPLGRAISLGSKGEVDAMLIRLSLIETSMPEFLRVPVILGEGEIFLYCQTGITCNEEVLNDGEKIVGIFSGVNATKMIMEDKKASVYEISTFDRAHSMFTKKRLNYLISLDKSNLGYYIADNPNKYQQVIIKKYQAFHYLHQSKKSLLPELTKALDAAVQEVGPIERAKLILN